MIKCNPETFYDRVPSSARVLKVFRSFGYLEGQIGSGGHDELL